jgi:hypothetical protein
MRNSLSLLITLITFTLIVSYQGIAQNKSKKNVSISEGTEWSNTWMVATNKHDLPRVLIIGDSHVERYYQPVTNKLNKIAYCCKFTTSRSLGDPALIAQLKALFFSYKFDVITFNNGLHGVEYSDEQYSSYIPTVYKLFKKSNPRLKLIWVNTTPRRIGGKRPDFDQYNQGVINRNKAVEEFTRAKNIPLVDFYTPASTNLDFFDTDGIHFSKPGVEEQAKMVTSEILKALESQGK